jgi:hypothetical protein
MTLWRLVRTWWWYRQTPEGKQIGEWMVVPDGAKVIEKPADPVFGTPHTIGWKVVK